MLLLQRWLNRHGVQVGLLGLVIGTAWLIRQTQGAAIYDLYQVATLAVHHQPTQEQILTNARVQELQGQIVELESQKQQLQTLLGHADTVSEPRIVAPVVGHSADQWWQQITVSKGRNHGIQEGYIATAPGGLVGRVVNVTATTSRILLVSDPSHRVGTVVSRSRNMGHARGQASNRAVMQFFDKAPNVQSGDVVTTSSYSEFYPKGLVVGRIESMDMNKSPAPEAIIQLSVPISSLEWVVLQPGQAKKLNPSEPAPVSQTPDDQTPE